jgi:nucleoside-diphosphate-sugar epimerase
MRVNADGTATLATAAAAAGVRRLIYLSSVGVLGNASGDSPFTASSTPRPHNAYAESKLAGEVAARSAGTHLEVVVLRVPLVYGSGVRANFYRLLEWVDKERPLPLGVVANRRSLLNVWNLCDILQNTLKHPTAAGRTWLISDGEDLSTPDLIRRIASAMRRRARLLRVPIGVLNALGRLTGRQAQLIQLCGSLAVDITQTCNELGWRPPVSVEEGLARTVEWYVTEGRPRS